jgi:threonine dehydratase
VGLFADGVAVREVGEETFRLCQEYVDEIILVDTDDTCAAIKDVFEDTRSIISLISDFETYLNKFAHKGLE